MSPWPKPPAALPRCAEPTKVLRDAIADGAVDDPTAIMLLGSLAHDEDDEDDATITPREFRWLETI